MLEQQRDSFFTVSTESQNRLGDVINSRVQVFVSPFVVLTLDGKPFGVLRDLAGKPIGNRLFNLFSAKFGKRIAGANTIGTKRVTVGFRFRL